MKATNRQKILLKFFHVDFSTNLSSGAAGWEISQIMAKFENRKLWNSYLYLTKDFDNQTDELMPVDTELIENTIVPDGWTSELSKSDFMFEVATEIVEQNGPYDLPEPEVVFTDHTFLFTGKFEFGSRSECQKVTLEHHGKVAKSISAKVNYLVIGMLGNDQWKNGTFGSKIEKAIFIRREHGHPAIISESHWTKSL